MHFLYDQKVIIVFYLVIVHPAQKNMVFFVILFYTVGKEKEPRSMKMRQKIFVECYEGLNAQMLTEALLQLLPEQSKIKETVKRLLSVRCSDETKQAMLKNLQDRIGDFSLPAGAEQLFARAYAIWLNAKTAVQKKDAGELKFSGKDFDGVMAMMTAAICMDQLQIEEVICSEIYEGFGQIYTERGIMPVPLPETLYTLMNAGIPLQMMEREGAWVTPDGAAILAASRTTDHLPENYHIIKQGVGNGIASNGEAARLRVMLFEAEGETVTAEEEEAHESRLFHKIGKKNTSGKEKQPVGAEKTAGQEHTQKVSQGDMICKMECNLDDCSGEVLGYTMERLMQEGALDVCYLPIYMKKNRPAYMLTVLCRPTDQQKMEKIIFGETTTIGIRRQLMERTVLQRKIEQKKSSFGEVAVKRMIREAGETVTLEYETVAAIARKTGLPFREVYRCIERELFGKNKKGEETV